MIADISLKNIRIVLVEPSHPGNIGAAARAIKTMGLADLYLVAPREFPHADATARAAGATDVLERARVCATLNEALTDCALAVATSSRQRELRHETLDAREVARTAVREAESHPVAIIFGNETFGLTSEQAGLCNLWAYVPANPEYSSLNLGAAVQIFAYELRMAIGTQTQTPPPEFTLATQAQVEQLYRHFEETMTATGFLDPANPKRLLPRLRRLLARARLETEEVNILRGFLKSVHKTRRS